MDMTTDADAVYEVIRRRRDVRSEFTGDPVPVATLQRLLSAAHAAPSVGLSQFVVIASTTAREQFRDHVAGERAAFDATLSSARAEVFSRIKVEGIMESSLGIVVTYDSTRGAPGVLGRRGRHAIADAGLYSTCLAIQNLWLAATSEGYGLGWVSFYREPFLRHLVGIPDHVRPVAWLCVGPVTRLQDSPDLERHHWRSRRPLK